MLVSSPFPPQEGIGFYVWNLCQFLATQGHQVQIITRGQAGKPYHEILEGIPIWRPRFLPVYPLHVYLHAFFVQRLVKRLEPEVDVFHLHSPLPPPIRTLRPILLTIHSLMLPDARSRKIEGIYDLLTKLQAPMCYLLEKQLSSISQQVTAVSPPVADEVQRLLPKMKTRVDVMWNGVDARFFKPEDRVTPNPNELLFVGRLAPGKGLQDLITAFKTIVARIPEIRLTIAGNGPLYNSTMALVSENGLENSVRLVGHVSSREALRTLYQHAWGLILPSHHESMPGVMLEAMACGTPVIATRVGGIPAVIKDSTNGLLVSPRRPDELGEAIYRLLQDSGLRARLGESARHTVEEKFTWQVIGAHYISQYHAILDKAPQ